MDFPLEYLFYLFLGFVGLAYLVFSSFLSIKPNPPLPPGNFGWPVLGETMELQRSCRSGRPAEFFTKRMQKHNKHAFKSSLLGEKAVILCGPAANKFLFSSEKKLVLTCWPASLKKLFGDAFFTAPYEEAVRTRKVVTSFLKQETLNEIVERFDTVCKKCMRVDWAGKERVLAFDLIKKYAFLLACKFFASIDEVENQMKLLEEFNVLLKGVFELPIYFPGTRYYKAVRSAGVIRGELLKVIEHKRKKRILGTGVEEDLISHLMEARDEEGRFLTDKEIADNVILLMDSGHDTSSSTMVMLIKYLAEMPDCYRRVLEEQKEIALSKGPGELLNKNDIQKMKYSWNVVSEVLRVSPPIQATFRRAIEDFTYAGFSIPKGWKVWWTVNSTHKVAEYFPDPSRFDPSRFEDGAPAPYTYTPFGGGPRMCPGREFARLEILVFLHNLVRQFRWELVFPDEKICVDPMPTPSNGLPVYLYPHARI